MTTDDLVFLDGQFHFSVGRDFKIKDATFVGRVGLRAPDSIPAEHRDAIEGKRTESVEIRISSESKLLDEPLKTLVPKVLTKALTRFDPLDPVSRSKSGEIL